jgi:hypothetical protein
MHALVRQCSLLDPQAGSFLQYEWDGALIIETSGTTEDGCGGQRSLALAKKREALREAGGMA